MTISTILPVGNGTGLTGTAKPTGIAGLFSSLFSMFNTEEASLTQAISESISPDATIDSLLTEITPELQEFADFIIQSTNQQDIAPEDIIVEFRALVVEVQEIEIKLGNISTLEELSMAYEKLGFSKDEAIEKVKQVSLVAQLLEAFKQHTGQLSSVSSENALENILGILQANEYSHSSNLSKTLGFNITEVRKTAIAFTSTISITPKTDFVEKVAEKIIPTPELIKAEPAKVVEINPTELTKVTESLTLDKLFPAEAVPFASLNNLTKEVIPTTNLTVKDFASPVLKDEKIIKSQQKADIVIKGTEIKNTAAKPAVSDLDINKVQSQPVAEKILNTTTVQNIIEETVTVQQKHASPLVRPVVENSLQTKDAKPATSANFANHNGTDVRSINAIAPINGKDIIQMKPNENGEIHLINNETSEEIDIKREEIRFTERLERNIQIAKHNHGLAKVAEQAKVGEQINIQVKNLVKQGGGDIRITLKPAELGQVDIHLKIIDGKVQGTILAQNLEVIEQMARDLRTLQQGLADAGLELDSKGIQFQVRDENESSNKHANNGKGESTQEDTTENVNDKILATGWVNPDKLIDVSI